MPLLLSLLYWRVLQFSIPDLQQAPRRESQAWYLRGREETRTSYEIAYHADTPEGVHSNFHFLNIQIESEICFYCTFRRGEVLFLVPGRAGHRAAVTLGNHFLLCLAPDFLGRLPLPSGHGLLGSVTATLAGGDFPLCSLFIAMESFPLSFIHGITLWPPEFPRKKGSFLGMTVPLEGVT